MNRRQLLKLLVSGVAAQIVDPEQLLWTPEKKTIIDLGALWKPHPAQIAFLNGIDEGYNDGTYGTWLGINRSTTPFPFRELMKAVTLDPKKGLYVIDSRRMDTDVGSLQENGKRSKWPTNNANKKAKNS